jgi:hypothetical protein
MISDSKDRSRMTDVEEMVGDLDLRGGREYSGCTFPDDKSYPNDPCDLKTSTERVLNLVK